MAILSPNTDVTMQSVVTAAGASRLAGTEPLEELVAEPLTDDGEHDENGRTADEIFDELEDDNHVATRGHTPRLARTVSTGGSTATGYSAGSGSGSGSDA